MKDSEKIDAIHIPVVSGKWVSVKDKLPDCIHIVKNSSAGVDKYSDTMLVWCDNKLMVMSLQYGFFGEAGEYCYIWCNHFGDITNNDPEWDDEYEPTHWMPLPEKPISEIKPANTVKVIKIEIRKECGTCVDKCDYVSYGGSRRICIGGILCLEECQHNLKRIDHKGFVFCSKYTEMQAKAQNLKYSIV